MSVYASGMEICTFGQIDAKLANTSQTRFHGDKMGSNVSVRLSHIDSYKLLAAQAVGVSSGSVWMDELASPGRTAARY